MRVLTLLRAISNCLEKINGRLLVGGQIDAAVHGKEVVNFAFTLCKDIGDQHY